MKVLGAAIGNCVHIAGVLRFLNIAEREGYEAIFLGPAVPIDELIEQITEYNPDLIGVSYRLSPESAERLFMDLKRSAIRYNLLDRRWVLGCTAPLEPIAKRIGMFEAIFTGFATDEDVIAFLRGHDEMKLEETYPQNVIERVRGKAPIPILRHHFGLPSLEETIRGVEKIAEAKVLDVISIGPDQNAQEFFFRPSEMKSSYEGAGGVPIRTADDLKRIYKASRCGNYPLLRCYSGTQDLLKWAELLKYTINNAWCATPLLWYSELDGRSKRPLLDAIRENQENHRWHARNKIPVEFNEPHHWSLRGAHDTIAVTMAYLSAYNAKAAGVDTYIAQYMLNTPLGTSPSMDIAKMLAKIELVESLHDDSFITLRQVRSGLFAYPPDLDMGKGQLAASIYTGMLLKPHIVHVVGFCEADHAATADDVIESCKIARRVIRECLLGSIDPAYDKAVLKRKSELVREAWLLISAIRSLADPDASDPLTDPMAYVRAVSLGVLDAPQLRNNPIARGELKTRMINGACLAIDKSTGEPISEFERLQLLDIEEVNKALSDLSEKLDLSTLHAAQLS